MTGVHWTDGGHQKSTDDVGNDGKHSHPSIHIHIETRSHEIQYRKRPAKCSCAIAKQLCLQPQLTWVMKFIFFSSLFISFIHYKSTLFLIITVLFMKRQIIYYILHESLPMTYSLTTKWLPFFLAA